MVRVKDFCGAVFHPKDYEHFLHSNIEHLEGTPMGQSFRTSEMLADGQLFKEHQPFFYIYRQIYLDHTSYGILA